MTPCLHKRILQGMTKTTDENNGDLIKIDKVKKCLDCGKVWEHIEKSKVGGIEIVTDHTLDK